MELSSFRSTSDYFLEFGRDAMACRFEVLMHPGRPSDGPELACEALDTITFLEDLWSVYRPTSELSRVNERASNTEVIVSASTLHLFEVAKNIHRRTQGSFDITSHQLTKVWGFFRRQGKMPTDSEIQEALSRIGTDKIQIDTVQRSVRFTSSVEVNPGGIGKGLAIDMAVGGMESKGLEHYAMHGGKSSVRCRGNQDLMSTQPFWSIAVRHPEQSERVLGTLRLCNQSLGTSGPANQFFYFRGKRFGHIIDPRTGWPSEGMLSVTVLHPLAGWADALATGLYVMGVDRAIEFCENNPDTSMLAILPGERQGQVEIVTCNLSPEQWTAA